MNKGNESPILKGIDIFVKPFLGKDVNYPVIREILKLKLLLDKRRVPKVNTMKNGKEVSRSMLLTCFIYMIMGLFIAGFQVLGNLFVANVFSYGALIFMLLSVYISEYSVILLDTTEKSFFGSLPVGKREMKIAKDIHIAYYIGMIAASTMLPSIVAAVFSHGILYGILYLGVGSALVVFCLHLAGSLYYLLLKFFSGERLKDILNAFQVFITIAIILSYQILPRIIHFQDLSKMDLSFNYFLFAIPSAWFAAVPSIFFEAKSNLYFYGLAAVAVFAIILLELVYKNKIVKEFDRELEKLTEEVKENTSLSCFSNFICKFLSKDRQEKAFMELVLIQISRDRSIKMKLYPQLANAVIIPLIFLFSRAQEIGITNFFSEMKTTPYFLGLYMIGLSSGGIYMLIGQTENKESRLFYQILPIGNLSKCIRAGIKVVIFRYLTPLFILMTVFFTAASGTKILFDVLIIYVAFLFITSFMIRIGAWMLPFSSEVMTNNAGHNLLIFILSFLISGGFGIVHFMIRKIFPLKVLALVVMIAAYFILWKFWMNKSYVIERE